MLVSKDIYLYITQLSDVKTMMRMLSVNKKFRSYFEQVISQKYPDILKFNKKNKNIKEFYLEMLFYISKIDVPKEFNPKTFYFTNNMPIYIYGNDPLDYDSENDYDYVMRYDSIDRLKHLKSNGIMFGAENLPANAKIHVFLNIEGDYYDNFHKSKIYYPCDFKK